MSNKKTKKTDELWSQYGVQLHPRYMRNVISGPDFALFPDIMSHVTSHRRHMWYRHVQLIEYEYTEIVLNNNY